MTMLDAMVSGYIAGFKSSSESLPECHKGKSIAWRHGWLNGRDDRIGQPRESAAVLRRQAEMILSAQEERI